MNVIKLEIFEK